MKLRTSLSVLALALLIVLPVSAQAYSEYMNAQSVAGYGSSGQIHFGASLLNVYWHPMKGYADAAGTIRREDFYCIDLQGAFGGGWHQWEVLPTTDPGVMSMGGDQGTLFGLRWAAHLYDTYAAGITEAGGTATQRAALQLAIWEALYDGAAGYSYNLLGGTFWTTDNAAVRTQANAYLAAAQGQGVGLKWHDGQDLLGGSEVPEPTSLVLVGLVLVGSSVAALKRKKRA